MLMLPISCISTGLCGAFVKKMNPKGFSASGLHCRCTAPLLRSKQAESVHESNDVGYEEDEERRRAWAEAGNVLDLDATGDSEKNDSDDDLSLEDVESVLAEFDEKK